MSNCFKCDAPLSSDEIALHKKLFGLSQEKHMCIKCSAEYLGVSETTLTDKISHFKKMGCTLFE